MKLFSAEQIRAWDAFTIAHEPISSLDLMERAAKACAAAVLSDFAQRKNIIFLCGPGNNGGDGLAMARLLQPYFQTVQVFAFGNTEKQSADFKVNWVILQNTNVIHQWVDESFDWNEFLELLSSPNTLIADALFGTGLSKSINEGVFAQAIDTVNACGSPVFSIDIPSGLFADSNEHHSKDSRVIKADITYTFERPKLQFLFAENSIYTGRIKVLSIGLHGDYVNSTQSTEFVLNRAGISKLRRNANIFSHKGNFGHGLIVGGSTGKAGAALLATKACMRSGAGLTSAWVPKNVQYIIQQQAPEAMCVLNSDENFLSETVKWPSNITAMGIGPGLGTEQETAKLFKNLLATSEIPLVLDADALNLLSENKTWISFLPADTILTPHPKEFDRLTQTHASGYERWKTQVEFSKRYHVYVVLKGAYTSVTTPLGKTFFNTTGNPGMATGGSGDVLTGIITGLRAQGFPAVDSALIGVFVHGLAGDFAYIENSREALLASDIISYLGNAFHEVFE